MDLLQHAYIGNQRTRTGIFNILLITLLIKKLVWLVYCSLEPTESHQITKKESKSFIELQKTLKNNGFPSSKCSFKKYLQNHSIRRTEKLKRFTSTSYVQGVSESISRILTEVGIGVALKPHQTLSSLFRKRKHAINFEQKRVLVYQVSCRDCNAVYVGET